MFLSLKKHWESAPSELTDALMQLSTMLLRALRVHSVRGDAADFHRFQSAIIAIEQRLAAKPDPKEILLAAGEVVRGYEDFCYEAGRYHEVHRVELRAMMAMLTSTIAQIHSSSGAACESLSLVESRMEKGVALNDLVSIKAELGHCLAMIREESVRQREDASGTIRRMEEGIRDSQTRLAEATPPSNLEPLVRDEVTGLATRPDAEAAIAQARLNAQTYIAVFPVDRFTLIESRFGKGAIDQVIVFFAQYFEERLTRVDRLFRWSDNALIAVIIRDSPSDSVRAEITRYASAKLEMMLKHHGRQILLPMSSSWTMFRSSEGGSVSALVRKIDGFLRNEMHLKESF